MARHPSIETFNTHRMSAEVVRAVATGRDEELEEILTAIRRAAAAPEQAPQPLIVYGERGSGKSFFMRMVELEAASVDQAACVLLPEEQYNIRAPAQILEAVNAKLQGRDWMWRLDRRPPAEAWDTAVGELHAALDARFGPGHGIVVVLLENFDTLARGLFGAEAPRPGTAKKTARSAQALEQRQGEERLRKLMNARGGRFMLVATATGTVDLDYERPLFQAFRPIDLRTWSADTSILYFNKRRELENAPPLSEIEEGRARAITDFTGGNPRLAELLGGVLASPDARDIASILDQLADKLADYYRRRLDDLSPTAAGLIDALVRGGEPASQSALAERVAGQQHQIADAFSYLRRSRLVAAVRERGGASLLYRVKDRLFVHFYRRRYDATHSHGLAPIAELLERFYTPRERQVLIQEHLERGEFDDARAYGGLPLGARDSGQGFCVYRDRLLDGRAATLFAFAGVSSEELEAVRGRLRDHPERAYKEWTDRARAATTTLARTAALLLKARAASRWKLDPTAHELLENAVSGAKDDATSDALIIAQDELASFAWHRLRDKPLSLSLAGGMRELLPRASTAYARGVAQNDIGFASFHAGQYDESLRAGTEAMSNCGDPEIVMWALKTQFFAHRELGHAAEALSAVEELVSVARQRGDRSRLCAALNLSAEQLNRELRHNDALVAADEALGLARDINSLEDQLEALNERAHALSALRRREETLVSAGEAVALAHRFGDVRGEAYALAKQAWHLGQLGCHEEAIGAGLQGALRGHEARDANLQAEALRCAAWSQWQLKQIDVAQRTYDEAINVATTGEQWWEVSENARQKSAMLGAELSASTQAVQAATVAVAAAERAHNATSLISASTTLVGAARHVATQGVAGVFAKALDAATPATEPWALPELADVVTATARNHEWLALLRVAQDREAALSKAFSPWVFRGVGKAWAEEATAQGRAATFGVIANELGVIDTLMGIVPTRGATTPEERRASHRVDLISGLLGACSDAGLLRDLADLFVQVFGEAVQDHARKMRRFAEFHEADDKERVLQRFDPDLATMTRRMWNLPDPKDEVALRTRLKAR